MICFWKLVCELSLYFVIAMFAGSLAGVSGALLPSFFIIVICGTLAHAVQCTRFKGARYALLLPMAAAFVLSQNMIDRLILILPAAYIILQTAKMQGDITYYRFHDNFKFGLPFMGAALVIMTVFYSWNFSEYVVPYMLLYLISGVLCLRQLRNTGEASGNRVLRIYDICVAAVTVAAGVLLTSKAAADLARKVLEWIRDVIISPAVTAVAYVMGALMNGLWWIVSQIDYNGTNELILNIKSYASEQTENAYEESAGGMIIGRILLGLAVTALFVGLAAILYRFLRKSHDERENVLREVRSEITGAVKGDTNVFDRSPRGRARHAYRRFMRLCAEFGARLKNTDTTSDISAAASAVLCDPPGNEELTELYRRARYSGSEFPADDAVKAESALKSIKAHAKHISGNAHKSE